MLAFKTSASGVLLSWHLQDAVVGKQRHDAIEIVRV